MNLANVRDVVDRKSGLIDGASMQISVYLDYKADAEEEWREVEQEDFGPEGDAP